MTESRNTVETSPTMQSVKIREFIEVIHLRGDGSFYNPIRRVISIYTKDGHLISEADNHLDTLKHKINFLKEEQEGEKFK